jgi:hypothetical protein
MGRGIDGGVTVVVRRMIVAVEQMYQPKRSKDDS